MQPLSDDEAALLYHIVRWGSTGYPVVRRGRFWFVDTWRSVKGCPVAFKTKKAATAQFEAWHSSAVERLRMMRDANPERKFMITAVGIRGMDD